VRYYVPEDVREQLALTDEASPEPLGLKKPGAIIHDKHRFVRAGPAARSQGIIIRRKVLLQGLAPTSDVKALITGITEQDGYFLSQLLFQKRYEVYGVVKRSPPRTWARSSGSGVCQEGDEAAGGDITNTSFINRATYDTNMGSTLNVVNTMPRTRLYFAAYSEIFGRSEAWLENGRA
jgi:hypothetical protein